MLTSLWPILLFLAFPLPIGTDRRLRRMPWVTWTLIGLNVVCYAIAVSYTRATFSNSHSLIHDLINGPPCFQDDPAQPAPVFRIWGLVPLHPAFGTLFTYQFVHVSFGHLFWNMLFLWLFGPHVEDALGRVTFVALYFGGGVAAGLLHMAINLLVIGSGGSTAPLVGASGAISSVLAPFAVRFHRANIRLLWLPGLLLPGGWARLELPALWGLGVWLLQNLGGAARSLFPGQGGGTAYWAHIGGFVFGLVAAQLTDLLQDGRLDYLLQDARASLGRGQELVTDAITNYRAFLEHDPDNAAVRIELARALAQRRGAGDADRADAATELLAAVRLYARQGRSLEAARACADARTLGLPLALSARERLRLAGLAEERADPATAVWLLRSLLAETPDAPEDEIVRLKLGHLLVDTDPAAARPVLAGFLDKYPDGPWAGRVRDLLRQTYV